MCYLVNDLDKLIDLYSSKTIRTMTSLPKKIYKKSLIGISIMILCGKHNTYDQDKNLNFINTIKKNIYKKDELEQIYDKVQNIVNKSLSNSHFKKPYDDEFTDKIIFFMRRKLLELREEDISLFQAKELSGFLNFKRFFSINSIHDYTWIELELSRGLIPTFPEMIIFNDLKVFWNKYLDILEVIDSFYFDEKFINNNLNYLSMPVNREKHYELGALYRNLVFLSVSYVESYLYHLFCLIREVEIEEKSKVSRIVKKDMIQDTEIIEKVLFVLYPNLEKEISDLYTKYKCILKHRDRYVHASPLIDKSNNSPHLKPLLDINTDRLIIFLQTSIDIVLKIDSNLPKELKLLFWFYNDKINFKNLEKIELTNHRAKINEMDYYKS